MRQTKNPKLKIAIIAHSLYPIAQPYAGGLEMVTQLICDRLVEHGHEVILFAHPDSQTKAQLIPLLSREDFEKTTYPNEHQSVGMTVDEMYQYQIYQEVMRQVINGVDAGLYDIVHNHSLHHVPMLMGQAMGKRFFTTFHTPIFAHLRMALMTLRRGTNTQFTAVSKFQQALYAEFVPTHVVYNGIDVTSFTAKVNAPSEEVYFWFGRICPEKGTHLAMQYCLEAGKKLIIAGPKSNQSYFEQEVAPILANDAQGAQRLNYVGHLNKDEVNAYLRQATAMLFTSTWEEPYGLTLAESLACGTPVLGFNVGASAEIVSHEVGVIVPKLDKNAFIAGFEQVKQISREACRAWAEQFCSGESMVAGYEALYWQTLDSERNSELDSGFDHNANLNCNCNANLNSNINANHNRMRPIT